MSAGERRPEPSATWADLAELERLRDQAKHHEDDSGAVAGMTPLDRVNRIDVLAAGLAALAQVFDSANHADHDHQVTALGWAPALGLVALIARDIGHENGALWSEVRRARESVQSDGEWIAAELDNIEGALASFDKAGDKGEIAAALVNVGHARNGLASIRGVTP